MRRVIAAAAVMLIAFVSTAASAGPATARACRSDEVFIPPGTYRPFFKTGSGNGVRAVAPLCLSSTPTTEAEYLGFVRANPRWRKSQIKALFAEGTYLADWRDDLAPPRERLTQPVAFVSWFAASAFCESRGGRLPTVPEWERFAGAPAPPEAVGRDGAAAPFSFAMGVKAADLADTQLTLADIWEWTADFNSALVSGRIGTAEGADPSLFCGDGFRAVDASNYAAFLRYSFRSSLRADFALKNLGFRCARELP
jgi:sulfatase modifying factor 1